MRRTDRERPEWLPTPRTTRWWEWLLLVLLFTFAAGARATTVYKCVGDDGGIAYQGVPCAETQYGGEVKLAPPPPFEKSPVYAVDRAPATSQHAVTRSPRDGSREPISFECRSADGQVFYRHSTCPHSVPAATAQSSMHGSRHGSSGGGSVAVSARRIERDEACRQIHAGGAIGRAGHEHDESVSTYERNLGRDPCR